MKEPAYNSLLIKIKTQIQTAQIKSVAAANSQMLWLYWQLGNIILENQAEKGWGAKIIQTLATDLKKELPMLKGFSERNLKYMRKFAESYNRGVLSAYTEVQQHLKEADISQQSVAKLLQTNKPQFVQQAVAQIQEIDNQMIEIVQQPAAQLDEPLFMDSIVSKISWAHHMILMDKMPHLGKRLWYMLNSLEHGNSRNILAMQIENGLFERQVASQKINNFFQTLPAIQSDFANYLLKGPSYIFDLEH